MTPLKINDLSINFMEELSQSELQAISGGGAFTRVGSEPTVPQITYTLTPQPPAYLDPSVPTIRPFPWYLGR